MDDYRKYKCFLRWDFMYSCAYCLIHENYLGGVWSFAVDHFRPKSRFPELEGCYGNLYYSCCRCNTYKGNVWPSPEQVRRGLGFVDPCEEDPFLHFMARCDGSLVALSGRAKYTLEHVRLNRKQLVELRRWMADSIAGQLLIPEGISALKERCERNGIVLEASKCLDRIAEEARMLLHDLINPPVRES